MTQILHIIGINGVGKSTLARQIQAAYTSTGRVCLNLTDLCLHEAGRPIDVSKYRQFKYAKGYSSEAVDVAQIIIEHLQDPSADQVQKGDVLIRMERAA